MDGLQQLFGFKVSAREHSALREYCRTHGITMRDFALHFLQTPLTDVVLGRDPMHLEKRETSHE